MSFRRSGDREFSGFVVDRDDLARKFTVEILVDGWPIKTMRASDCVYDLARENVGDGCYGFSCSLPQRSLEGVSLVEARLANLGTSIGTPVEITEASAPIRTRDGPGSIRWMGGLRFSGWIDSDRDAPIDVHVDGKLTQAVHPTGWTHTGTTPEDARAVRAFDFHLPEQYANGKPAQLNAVNRNGEELAGSPAVFIAFADGLKQALFDADGLLQERPRAEIFDLLLPMSLPMSRYQSWKERFPIAPTQPVSSRAAVVIVEPGNTEDTIDSLNSQTLTWVAVCLPSLPDPAGFQPELAAAFLTDEAKDCDFVLFALAGTVVHFTTLQRIGDAFKQFEHAHAVYGDLDIVSDDGSVWPLAFSAFDYERLLEQGYCAHFFAMRRATATRLLKAGASNLFRLFNSLFDAGTVAMTDIVHIPGAVASVQFPHVAASAKALASATYTHLERRGIHSHTMAIEGSLLPSVHVLRQTGGRHVTIIIPTRNRRLCLQRCLDSISAAIEKRFAEIIIVDNDSSDPDTLDYLSAIGRESVTVLRVAGPCNFARLNNVAAEAARGELLCLLNNDVTAQDDVWLDELLARIAEEDVGAVGALLLWPTGVVQHGGVVLGPNFAAAHAFNDRIGEDEGYGGLLRIAHECSAVTAACMVTRRTDFLQVGGMDEVRFPVNFNDVDYCLKLRALGKRIVFTPHARLFHLESASRGPDRAGRFDRELQNLRRKWSSALAEDPYYSPMLSFDKIPFSALAWPPRSMHARVNSRPIPTHVPSAI
jgi:GT2 family glycosyltransferase